MNDKILTISVAAYNVESILNSTLNSLVVPEILDDIEVLVVDDGATDGSLKIAKDFESKYPNTFKAVHKANGGYGSTVNYSIDNASGKYFKLLDGDDWYDRDGLIKLINVLKNTDADVIFTQYNYAFESRLKLAIYYDEAIAGRVLPVEKFNFNAGTPMHALTYKTKVLRESNVRLEEHMLYTDNTYAAIPFIKVNTILFENFSVYNYRLGVEGQSVGRKSIVKHIDESRDISMNLVKFYRDNVDASMKFNNYIKVNVASTCVNYVVGILKMPMNKSSLKRLVEFDNQVKIISEVIYNKMIDIDRKASRSLKLIRKSNYTLYWFFAFVYRFID